MTLAIRDPNEAAAKPSQNSEVKSNQSPRSNPVCLEVGVTIRSLPNEPGSLNQPLREDVRTVIVFDNGAVLRSAKPLAPGQTVVLSNAKGRDVVCKVVGGRNLPTIKGYVEVEFMEAVDDFWHIHENLQPIAAAKPAPDADSHATPALPEQEPPKSSAVVPTASAQSPHRVSETAATPAGSGPSFEDLAGVVKMSPGAPKRSQKAAPPKPVPEVKPPAPVTRSEAPEPATASPPRPPKPELLKEKPAIPAAIETVPIVPQKPNQSPDVLSASLLNSAPSISSIDSSRGWMPIVVAGAVFVLVGAGAGAYLVHQGFGTSNLAKTTASSQPPSSKPEIANSPEPLPVPQPADVRPADSGQTTSSEQIHPAASVAAIPSTSTDAAQPESRKAATPATSSVATTNVAKPPAPGPSRGQAFPNLKMRSPSSSGRKPSNSGEDAAPVVATPEAANGAPPSALLSSVTRTSNVLAPPVAPPTAAATTKMVDPKLISSVRPVYPDAAKVASIQGSVIVSAGINENGRVVNPKVTSGPMILRQAALAAVKQWKYSPATIDGKPVSSEVIVNVDFRLK